MISSLPRNHVGEGIILNYKTRRISLDKTLNLTVYTSINLVSLHKTGTCLNILVTNSLISQLQ